MGKGFRNILEMKKNISKVLEIKRKILKWSPTGTGPGKGNLQGFEIDRKVLEMQRKYFKRF